MDNNKICINKENSSNSKHYLKINQEGFKNSSDLYTDWSANDSDKEKLDSKKRWSYGSDTSIEPLERVENRLCCSPVDFDFPEGSENEDLIVNSLDDSDETFNKYLAPKGSPSCSPTFDKISYSCNKKKSNKNHDVDTADDELIDYSKIYMTDKDYAETDLDQPTDYSLRYPDEEDKKESQFYCTNLPDDTVKTYHTEGTPNNFSKANSMTDLLTLDSKESYEATLSRQQKQNEIEKSEKVKKDLKIEIKKKSDLEVSKIKSTEEETNKIKTNKSEIKSNRPERSPKLDEQPTEEEKINKVVKTFKRDETYAQETPLMFSRSSSLDSLSDFDQHSIHDDQSSIVSDFSHRTSGAVSPSDLPDSPTQNFPPNPSKFRQKNDQSFKKTPSRKELLITNQKNDHKLQGIKHCIKVSEPLYEEPGEVNDINDFFVDNLVTFEKESNISSKAHSTTGSILSSLTMEEDEGSIYGYDNHDIINRIAAIRVRTSAAGMHQAPTQKLLRNNLSNEHDKLIQQYKLHKYLNKNSGYMYNSVVTITQDDIYSVNVVDNKSYNTNYENKISHTKYENDMKNENYNTSNKVTQNNFIFKRNEHNYIQRINNEDTITTDSLRIYCTEDTPTFVSPFSSHSNLSALSMLSISDDDSYLQDQFRLGHELRTRSHYNSCDTNTSSDASENDYCYEDDSPHQRRIDVSPFDSQLNLANLSLVCIEEEDEEEENEDEKVGKNNR